MSESERLYDQLCSQVTELMRVASTLEGYAVITWDAEGHVLATIRTTAASPFDPSFIPHVAKHALTFNRSVEGLH